jgi:hypothetical protein
MSERHFTQHAREQMAARNVTEEDVDQALRRRSGSPQPGTPGSVWVYGHTAHGGILKVCVDADDHNRVRTVFWAKAPTRDGR